MPAATMPAAAVPPPRLLAAWTMLQEVCCAPRPQRTLRCTHPPFCRRR
jgi:hypothetical protein